MLSGTLEACLLYTSPRLGLGRKSFAPHNLPLTLLGGGILWFGWFGFNAGSALAANHLAVHAMVTLSLIHILVAAPNETQPLYMLGIIQHSQNRNAEAAASLEKVVAAKEDPSIRYSLGILYAYYLEQPDKGLEQLQKALDNPNTPADLKKAVSEEVTKIKEHKNHTPQQAQ